MRSDFASLLEQAGFETSERAFWQRVIMIDNRILLPAKRLEEGDLMKLHGFNALILDRNGVPTHFCKCRPPTKDWIHQTEVCTRLSMEPALRHVLPPQRAVGSTDLHMAISAYVPGRPFEEARAEIRLQRLDRRRRGGACEPEIGGCRGEAAAFHYPDKEFHARQAIHCYCSAWMNYHVNSRSLFFGRSFVS